MSVNSKTALAAVYNDKVVRQFSVMAVVWGVVGMLVGVIIAAQLTWPELNLGISWLSYGRLRPLHTNAVIFAFGGCALFATSYYVVQRTNQVRLFMAPLAAFTFWGWQLVIVLAAITLPLGYTQGKEYAELHDVVDAVTPALSKHGLSTSWKLTRDEKDWLEVTCTLKHVGGHCETVSMGGPPDTGGAKNNLQARSSTKSYLERYTLKAICGVAEGGDDTDGNAKPAAVPLEILAPAREAAMNGWAALSAHIKSLSPEARAALEPESYALKKAAKDADAKGVTQ